MQASGFIGLHAFHTHCQRGLPVPSGESRKCFNMGSWRRAEGLSPGPGGNVTSKEDEKGWQSGHCRGSQGKCHGLHPTPTCGQCFLPCRGTPGVFGQKRIEGAGTVSGKAAEPRLGYGCNSALGGRILDSGSVPQAAFLPPARWHVPKSSPPCSCRPHFHSPQSFVA